VLLALACPSAGNAAENGRIQALEDKVSELSNELQSLKVGQQKQRSDDKLDVLTSELQKLKVSLIVPDEAPKYKSYFGLGPAASKVYGIKSGLSLGGYGEAYYKSYVDDKGSSKNTGDYTRFIIYAGYKFSKNIIMNAEIEYEHGTTGSNFQGKRGSVSLEFGYLDFLLSKYANLRAGIMLVPMGFINEMHESPLFHGNIRPDVERNIIPTTWREMGIGLYGNLTPKLQYKLYLLNGLNAKKFGNGQPLRSGRQKGNRVLFEDPAIIGRLDYTPVRGLLVGGSFYYGNSGQNQDFGGEELEVKTQLYDVHIQYKYRGFEFRTLGTVGYVSDTEKLSADIGKTVGERFYGAYGEVAYNFLPLILPETEQYLAPFFRYSKYNANDKVAGSLVADKSLDTDLITTGFTYKPVPNLAIKFDYKNYRVASGRKADEINVGFGFLF